jgi:DNA-directed RNA polymerase specialized sigma24 family protein
MHTLKEFDYDLWTTKENETVHYWARVKRTGEVCEVDSEVFNFLRSEENKMRYELRKGKSPVSLDVNADTDIGESASWIIDPIDCIENLICKMDLERFCLVLTEKQRDLFTECVINGKTQAEYARMRGVDHKTVNECLMSIRKKFEKFYGNTPLNT